MRSFIMLGAAALVIAGSASEAEARFRLRLGGGTPSYTPRPVAMPVSRSGLVVIPGIGLGSSAARANGYGRETHEPVPQIRSVLTAEAQAPHDEEQKLADAAPNAAPAPAPVVKVAQPWCRTGRVAGSGSGFCLMN